MEHSRNPLIKTEINRQATRLHGHRFVNEPTFWVQSVSTTIVRLYFSKSVKIFSTIVHQNFHSIVIYVCGNTQYEVHKKKKVKKIGVFEETIIFNDTFDSL